MGENTIPPRPAPAGPKRAPGAGVNAATGVVAFAIGAVLLTAAVTKIASPNRSPEWGYLVERGRWGMESGLLRDYAIGVFEIAFALVLLSLQRVRFMWLLTAVLFAGFGGYAGYYLAQGRPCGCFGTLLMATPLEFFTIKGVSLGLDIAFFILALCIAAARGARGRAILVAAIAGLLASGVGALYAWKTLPPPPEEFVKPSDVNPKGLTPAEIILRSELLADAREAPAGSPPLYVFVYSPTCEHCQMMLPIVEFARDQHNANPAAPIHIRIFAIPDLTERLNIPEHAWPSTPTVFFVRDGQVVMEGEKPMMYSGHDAVFPEDAVTLALTGQI